MSTRVLVVDDDPLVLRAISKALARDGFDVATASDALPALSYAEHHRPDIVVVDFNMPTCGLEVVRTLKATLRDEIFVAVLTGEDSEHMRARCLDAGADAVLIKPISPSELRRRLTAAALALKTHLAAS
jgi:two-component system KDP operon response regulator KdpE